MSGEALYERYKDALRRGHIASIQGRLDEALDAYAEAARIAPERATPHSSAGTALLRRRQPAEALGCFDAALLLAPADEGSLVGRAEALAGLDRRREAAEAWTAIAETRVATGRLADAVDAARRSLQLAEGRDRRKGLERLIARLRASEPDEPGRASLEQALRMLDGVAVAHADAPPAVAPVAAPQRAVKAPAGRSTADSTSEAVKARDAHAWPEADMPRPSTGAPPRPSPVPPRVRTPMVLERSVPDDLDIEALARAAEASLDAHDAGPAVVRILDLAAAHRLAGNRDAALDACYRGLAVAPDDLDLHLALAELYVERGWSALAAEKVELLDRLATLDGNEGARERVAAVRAAPA
jgi:tetratricopeptide (TPR) repeat protein